MLLMLNVDQATTIVSRCLITTFYQASCCCGELICAKALMTVVGCSTLIKTYSNVSAKLPIMAQYIIGCLKVVFIFCYFPRSIFNSSLSAASRSVLASVYRESSILTEVNKADLTSSRSITIKLKYCCL